VTAGPSDLLQADLTVEDVERLAEDLAAHAESLVIAVKGAAAERAPSLRDVPAIVRARAARGIQIRYRFEGAEWTDTLMIVESGARLVRMKLSAVSAQP
jgi:hypothetical protein